VVVFLLYKDNIKKKQVTTCKFYIYLIIAQADFAAAVLDHTTTSAINSKETTIPIALFQEFNMLEHLPANQDSYK